MKRQYQRIGHRDDCQDTQHVNWNGGMPIMFKLSENKEWSFREKKIVANFFIESPFEFKRANLSLFWEISDIIIWKAKVSSSNGRDTVKGVALQVFSWDERNSPRICRRKKIVFATLILFARAWNIQISSTERRLSMSDEYIQEEQATPANVYARKGRIIRTPNVRQYTGGWSILDILSR